MAKISYSLLCFVLFAYLYSTMPVSGYDNCDYYKCEALCKQQHPIRNTAFNEVRGACETVSGVKNFCHCYYNDPVNPSRIIYLNNP